MVLIAVITEWDKEVTDKIFIVLKIKQAQRNRKLEKYDYIPDSGSGLSVFIENIERFNKKDIMSRFFYTKRPNGNIIFYTCKRLESIPDSLIRVTDFIFVPLVTKKGNLKTLIFRNGSWMSGVDTKDYMKTHYFDFSKLKNWEQYLGESSVKIEKGKLQE